MSVFLCFDTYSHNNYFLRICTAFFVDLYHFSDKRCHILLKKQKQKSPLLIAFRNPAGDLLIRIKIHIKASIRNPLRYLQDHKESPASGFPLMIFHGCSRFAAYLHS